MEKYWEARPALLTATQTVPESPMTSRPSLTGFDRHRRTLVARGEEGWVAELGRYLADLPHDATSDMDVVKYWQDNHRIYPTLGRMALDILPCQASSVPCERLFSASKQVATDRRARLGAERFEELQLMKFAWRNSVVDTAAWNSGEVEQVEEYKDFLVADVEQAGHDIDADEVVIEY
jgi:hAT family C-terminal dimerisation region